MTYQITRDCCRSKQCDTCSHLGAGQTIRVTQAEHLTADKAKRIAYNWREYNPTIEPQTARRFIAQMPIDIDHICLSLRREGYAAHVEADGATQTLVTNAKLATVLFAAGHGLAFTAAT